ncbi:MAG: SDR family NAD(P)-dependent oxidoreductase [Cyanobacteria bacterium P01_F01_bin.86]
MTDENFKVFTVSPINFLPPAIAVATIRAGGVGILDREFCANDSCDIATRNFVNLLSMASSEDALGLRLKLSQINSSLPLLETLSQRAHWLILCHWQPEDLRTIAAHLPASATRKILLEITNSTQLKTLESPPFEVAGLIIRGHESGGWVGEEPAFILLQKLLGKSSYPLYLQGAVGLHTAAACRAVGASGVVLDDQLWLMPESPLPQAWRTYLNRLSGQEAIAIGERVDTPVRVLSRPGFAAITQLQHLAQNAEVDASHEARVAWQQAAEQWIGWGPPNEKAWPMGQGVGLAAMARERYHTTGRYIQALKTASITQIALAQQRCPLKPGAPLAVSHQTRYPIVQGPMTRVSDTAEFAAAVSQSGALPLIALALMRRAQVETLLHKAQTMLAGRSWGIGILGFVPHQLREEQLKVIERVKPPFALIAGGRPDQAAQLEQLGIAAYIHVPTPQLLQLFLQQGARRFVFEGRECGGHVGPLSSFVLWEGAVQILLQAVPPGEESQVHVLFAGGIHDAQSASMISVMAAPLADRGMKVGVLMGTAYLFTQEAVACGAIVEEFQQQALACHKTINLETGPGHASRCAATPFVQEFYDARRQMLAAGRGAEDIKHVLEDMTLGRLRMAAKGIMRKAEGLTKVTKEAQVNSGMYMIGQVAVLRQQVGTLAALHQDVAESSTQQLLNLATPALSQRTDMPQPSSDIAIIGIGTLLPKAQTPDEFWENILQQVEAITEIPPHRWDWRLYYDSDRQARDKVYSKWGGFLDDVPFDPLYFGIPPKSLKSIEPMQLLALETVRRALADAGTAYERREFDRENTSVILGASGGMADLGGQYATRAELPRMVENLDAQAWERLPDWTEESFPGLLMNVTAGRVANRFDLGGSNFTVDAACGSSLAAIDLAVSELQNGRANLAIAGGVDTVQSPFAYFCFSKTQALSPTGKARTFDKSADGIVISEGIAVVVLKRLEDAQRDGDRIYATIKAVASSSDGKGLSMTAPATAGQQRAFKRAYARAGISPNTIGLYEAHGTGTVAGDRTELESITSLLQAAQAKPKSCAIGSIKTTLGHTKSAAGVVALVKAALSLYHRVLPPHSNVEEPLDTLSDAASPLYLLKNPQPWLKNPEHPRRAALSSFGFGGTNFHAILEEYQGNIEEPMPGAKVWPWELIVLRAANGAALADKALALKEKLLADARPRLRDLAYSCAHEAQAQTGQPARLSLVVASLEQLVDCLAHAIAQLKGQTSAILPPYIQIQLNASRDPGQVAFLFPGQVAQYPGMARDIALYFPEMRNALEKGSQQLRSDFAQPLNQFIYPPSAYTEAQQAKNKERLTDTHIAQPIIGTVEAGYMDIAKRLGLKPDMVAGHSYGEYAALHAAGVLDRENFLRLSEIRGRVMARACEASDGAMAAVQATREELLAHLEGHEDVILANHNAPLQSVISGKKSAVRKVVERLQVADIMAKMLPVAGAFHSSLVESAQTSLGAAVSTVSMQPPQIPVYSNTTAHPYDPDIETIRSQLAQHLLSPVKFVEQITAMYEAGTRTFIELGPKSILTKLVSQILEGHDHIAVPIDGHRSLQGFLIALGTLFAKGVDFDITALFKGRDVQRLNLSQLSPEPLAANPNLWFVNGGGARAQNEAAGSLGNLPPLNLEMIAHAKQTQNDQGKSTVMPQTNGCLTSSSQGTDPAISQPATPIVSPINRDIHPQTATSSNDDSPQSIPIHAPITTPPKQTKPLTSLTEMTMQSSSSTPDRQPQSTGISEESRLAAYQAYQKTMRQFLSLQEAVMSQFLSGQSLQGSIASAQSTSTPPAKAPNIAPTHEATCPEPLPSVPPPQSRERAQPSPSVAQATSAVPAPVVVTPTHVLNDREAPQTKTLTATTALDRRGLLQTLITLVSDRTGYPPDMLGLDQDMEAELGIDSIKRVEIFAALQTLLPEPLASTVKGRVEHFTQVKTLNGLVTALLEESVTASSPEAANNTHRSESGTELLKRASLLQTLIDLVSERTGYPPEMLGLDQDMEAELGIDSIKRVEIFAALQTLLPQPLASAVKGRTEHFTQVKTLNGLVNALLEDQSPASKEGSNSLGKSPSAEVAPCQRYLTQGWNQPLPARINSDASLTGLFLITADTFSVAPQLSQLLQQQGASVAILADTTIASRASLAPAIAQLRRAYGPVTGIIHLASLGDFSLPDTLFDWHQLVQTQSKSLFHLLQICEADLRQTHGQVIAASLFGGHWGRQGACGPGSPLGGSSNGLLKTLRLEWPEVRAKVIDFDTVSIPQAAADLLKELLYHDEGQEIGYCQGNRKIFQIIPAPLASNDSSIPPMPVTPEPDWVVLSVGGGRGITAEIVHELVIPGMTLIVVGRSPLPGNEPESTQGIEDLNTLRQHFIQQARSQGTTPTPVQIERQAQGLQRDRLVRHNLAAFRQAGVQVEYIAADVTQAEVVAALMNGIYDRYGRLDAVVQGAGLIQDKLLTDKTPESFDQVFDTKVDSTYLLSRHLRPQSLKLVVLFASIAGRTGNRGQCDYAAANEVINRFACWMAQQWQNTRVMSINWGPWDVTGMASASVNRQFRERGVIPIAPEAGRRFFQEELQGGDRQTVELIAGNFHELSHPDEHGNQSDIGESTGFPLLTALPQVQPNSTVTLEQTLSLANYPFLQDHRIDGKPVVAAACALELLAEFVQAAWPEWVVCEAHDLRVLGGIVLGTEAGQPIQLKARASTHADATALEVVSEIVDAVTQRIFYRVKFIFQPQIKVTPTAKIAALQASPGLEVATAYRNYCFHGPQFQLLTAIDCFNEQGIKAQVKPSLPHVWLNTFPEAPRTGWLFDPGLVDVSLQIGLMWTHIHGQTGNLPSRFGRVVRYGSFHPRQTVKVEWRVKRFDAAMMVSDALFIDQNNQVLLQLQDMEVTCSQALNRLVGQC